MPSPTVITMHSNTPPATGKYGYSRPSGKTASSVRSSSPASMNVKITTGKRPAASAPESGRSKGSQKRP